MNYAPKYSRFIRDTKKVSKNFILPNKIYRLISYEYANGNTETLSGQRANLIFIFGIYKNEVHALKLNLINPDTFFRWMKKSSSNNISEKMLIESDLKSLLKQSDESGREFFTSKIKGNSVYRIEPRAYRTYKLKNIKNIEEIFLTREKLITIFGEPNLTNKESEQLDKKRVESKDKVEEIKPQEKRKDTSMEDFIDSTMDILNKE